MFRTMDICDVLGSVAVVRRHCRPLLIGILTFGWREYVRWRTDDDVRYLRSILKSPPCPSRITIDGRPGLRSRPVRHT